MAEKLAPAVSNLCQVALAKAVTNLTSLAGSLPSEVLDATRASAEKIWVEEQDPNVPAHRQAFLEAVIVFLKAEAARLDEMIRDAGGSTPGNGTVN